MPMLDIKCQSLQSDAGGVVRNPMRVPEFLCPMGVFSAIACLLNFLRRLALTSDFWVKVVEMRQGQGVIKSRSNGRTAHDFSGFEEILKEKNFVLRMKK
ncbi:hypothetical protein KM043_006695 [Ampulex compressa]|nr:hypothetical protein KM043_006695 [Ampulex compressa]